MADASPARAYTEEWLPGCDGTQFYTRTYAPPSGAAPQAVVVFVHGFVEHCGRYEWAHGAFAARGAAVFTYDQRGFGRTALDKAHRSRGSAYAKTSWREQIADMEWAVKRARGAFGGVPVFLMGQSMGGGLVLAFGTREGAPPAEEWVRGLSGIVASSPLVLQTFPAPKALRFVGGKASALFPALLIDAPIPVDDLSHDKAANDANRTDPLVIQKGSLKGLNDMLSGGEQLLRNNYKFWRKSVPLLITHGTADRVTSFKASKEFFDKVDAEDKEFMPFEGGFHELVNEPGGVREKYVDACVSWVLERAGRAAGGGGVGEGPKL